MKSVEVNQAQQAAEAFVDGSLGDVQPTGAELPPSRTAAAPTEGHSKRSRRQSDKGSRKGSQRAEWRNGLFNLSFDDDCGYLALIFPPVVDAPPPACSDGVGSSTDDGGPSAVKKESGRRASEPATERSWLGGGGAATYDGRSTEQLADISRVGSPGVPGPNRDTRPLISDDDQVGSGGQESALRILGEVLLPFLLAGLGSVFAGLVLDIVQVRICFLLLIKLHVTGTAYYTC